MEEFPKPEIGTINHCSRLSLASSVFTITLPPKTTTTAQNAFHEGKDYSALYCLQRTAISAVTVQILNASCEKSSKGLTPAETMRTAVEQVFSGSYINATALALSISRMRLARYVKLNERCKDASL